MRKRCSQQNTTTCRPREEEARRAGFAMLMEGTSAKRRLYRVLCALLVVSLLINATPMTPVIREFAAAEAPEETFDAAPTAETGEEDALEVVSDAAEEGIDEAEDTELAAQQPEDEAEEPAEEELPEAAPEAEAPEDYRCTLGEGATSLSAILAAAKVPLKLSDIQRLSLADEGGAGLLSVERDGEDYRLSALADFDSVRLALETEAGIAVVELTGGKAPEAAEAEEKEAEEEKEDEQPGETSDEEQPDETDEEEQAEETVEEQQPEATITEEATQPEEEAGETAEERADAPEEEPADAPEEEPADAPEEELTDAPEEEPTEASEEETEPEPTEVAEEAPGAEPTEAPTAEPTQAPTTEPTAVPTEEPTPEPTAEPTPEPTEAPTVEPTAEPTPEPTAEPTPEPVRYPAQSFTGRGAGMRVSVEAPEGAFPEGTVMRVRPVRDDATLSGIEDAVAEDFVAVKAVHAVDIAFYDAEGEELEPLAAISVVMSVDDIDAQQEAVVVHVDDDGNAAVVERAEAPEVAFDADAFSVYAMVITEAIEQVVKASDGLNYRITVAYGPESGIPEGAELAVEEITDGEACQAYAHRAADALRILPGSIGYGRLFDITILYDGQAVQPRADAAVQVRVTLDDADGAPVSVVHFAGGDEAVTASTEGNTVAFDAEGFSVYGFFTVDFYYNEYEYHLDGEGEMLLSQLFAALGIEASPANATAVTFSTPEYLSVERLGDDWKLTSLMPFDTEETLTAEFADGEIVVRVTDATGDVTYKLLSTANNSTESDTITDSSGKLKVSLSSTSDDSSNPQGTRVILDSSATNWAFLFWKNDQDDIVSLSASFTPSKDQLSKSKKFIAVCNNSNRRYVYYSVNSELMGYITIGNVNYTNNYTLNSNQTAQSKAKDTDKYCFGYNSLDGERYESASYKVDRFAQQFGLHTFKGYFKPTESNTYKINYKTAIKDGTTTTVYDSLTCDAGTITTHEEPIIDLTTGTMQNPDTLEFIDNFNVAASVPASDSNYVFVGWYTRGSGDEALNDKATGNASNNLASNKVYKETYLKNGYNAVDLVAVYAKKIKITYKSIMSNTQVSNSEETIVSGEAAKGSTASTTNQARKFVAWVDEDGNIVEKGETFVPTGALLRDGAEYTALFVTEDRQILGTSNIAEAVEWRDTVNINRAETKKFFIGEAPIKYNLFFNVAENYEVIDILLNGQDTKSVWKYAASARQYSLADNTIQSNFNAYLLKGDGLNKLVVNVKPKGTIKVNYEVSGPGSVSNSSDFAGLTTATGSTATPNSDNSFLGWYTSIPTDSDFRLSNSETITASELAAWVEAGYITADNQVITAKFGKGYTITYQQQLGNAEPTTLRTELITTNTPVGETAQPVDGYVFEGWYNGNDLLTTEPQLLNSHMNAIAQAEQDAKVTAKYSRVKVAQYVASNVKDSVTVDGVSTYGSVVSVGSEISRQDADREGALAQAVTAEPAIGCEFVGWEVKNAAGEDVEITGFDSTSPTIPAGIVLPEDVTFTATFKKSKGSIEIFYTVQQEETDVNYGATLTVGDRTVRSDYFGASNTKDTDHAPVISEVVPAGQKAQGCQAVGIKQNSPTGEYTYEIKGWAVGENWDSEYNKDKLFTTNTYFTPEGKYLKDGQYYRAVAKREVNFYILLLVNIEEAGDIREFLLNSDGSYTVYSSQKNKMIFVNGGLLTESLEKGSMPSFFVPRVTNNSYEFDHWEYNGEVVATYDAELANITNSNQYAVREWINEHSVLSKNENDPDSEDHFNRLVAYFKKKDAVNISYYVKGNIGGTVDNPTDTFVRTVTPWEINGSVAMADKSAGYGFDHWEDENRNIIEDAGAEFRPSDAYLSQDVTKTEYKFYAVFRQLKKVNIEYRPESPDKGSVTRQSETVLEGDYAKGSYAEAASGYVFTHWTREDTGEIVSTDPAYTPVLEDGDFVDATKTLRFVAHYDTLYDTSITVDKVVMGATDFDLTKVNTKIYIKLTKKGVEVKDVYGNVIIKEISIVKGIPSEPVVFSGLPYNDPNDPDDKYEVWEMHKVGDGYESSYENMLVGDDYQLSGIATENNSDEDGKGNNALLTSEHNHATVTLKNTYSDVSDKDSFTVTKAWRNETNTAPDGASVEITVYSEVGATTRAVKTITLDGNPDDKGESEAWVASFTNLPKLDSGRYKVRETVGQPGYTAYIDGGRTLMTTNTYMYNSGGKIINIKEDVEMLGSLKLEKQFSVPGYDAADKTSEKAVVVDGTYSFTLAGIADTATADISIPLTLTVTGGVGTWSTTSETYTLASNGYTATLSNLPIGTYTLTENSVTETVTKTISGQDVKFAWTVTGAGDYDISVGEETAAKVVNTFTRLSTLTVTKTVTGNMADTEQEFTFTVSGLGEGSYSYTKTGVDGTTEGTLDGENKTFTLKHGERVAIANLPYGAEIIVSEEAGAYTASYSRDGGTAVSKASATVSLTADATLAFTNQLNAIVDTGVSLDALPYITLLLLLGAAGWLARRRRWGGDGDE